MIQVNQVEMPEDDQQDIKIHSCTLKLSLE